MLQHTCFVHTQACTCIPSKEKLNTHFYFVAAKDVMTRFISIRTDYGKLKNTKLSTKSGQAAKKLTTLQQWKLQRFQFLDTHILPRTSTSEMGKVSTGFYFICVKWDVNGLALLTHNVSLSYI